MYYCGIDLGKKSSHFCIVDERRQVVREGRFRNQAERIGEAFGEVAPMRIVIEASAKSFWLADQLRRLGHTPILVDPGRTKAIGSARIKHDRLDARVLAELCQANLFAEVSHVTEHERLDRMPVKTRGALVRARAQLMTTVRSLVDSEGVELRHAAAHCFTAMVIRHSDKMPPKMSEALKPLLESIDRLSEQIALCDQVLKVRAERDPVMRRLQTTPGVGPIVSAAYVVAVRDPRRFTSGRSVGAYLGLVPSLYASGKTYVQGRITKRGNREARWLLTMAANALLRSKADTSLKRWGRKLAERHGRKTAVVAVARKLAAVMWSMWLRERDFDNRVTATAV